MDWTNDMVLEFLHNYEAEPVLWDPKNPKRRSRRHVNDAWERIQQKLTWSCEIKILKRKKDSLMACYRSLMNKVKKMKTDPDADDVYATTWFAFDSMHSFLGKVYDVDFDRTYVEVYPETSSRNGSTDDENSDTEQILPAKRKVVQIVKKYADESSTKPKENTDDSKNYCEMYGLLLAQKLASLPEEDRLILMNQIDNLVFETTLQASKKKRGDYS